MDVVATADLAQVATFLGLKQVARAVPVSPGTMTYYFGSREEFSREVFEHIFDRFYAYWSYASVEEALERLAGGAGDLAGVADAVASQVARVAPGPDSPPMDDAERRLAASFSMAEALLTAVAPNDSRATRILAVRAERDREHFATFVLALMEITGRSWRTGVELEQLVVAVQSLIEGFLHVRRIDPAAAPVAALSDGLLRLYLALTADARDLDADAADALHARFSRELHQADREVLVSRAVAAATNVYARAGWNGLTIAAVAAELGVDRIAVVRIFVDRRGLAAAIWADRLPALRRVARSLAQTPEVAEVVRIFLETLVDLARRDVALSAALLEGVFAASIAPDGATADALDPRRLVPLPQVLAPLLEARADQLALAGVPDGLTYLDAAALLCNTALHVAFTRPRWAEERVVNVVMGTTFAGMAKRRD